MLGDVVVGAGWCRDVDHILSFGWGPSASLSLRAVCLPASQLVQAEGDDLIPRYAFRANAQQTWPRPPGSLPCLPEPQPIPFSEMRAL